jgi:hypothetical protein
MSSYQNKYQAWPPDLFWEIENTLEDLPPNRKQARMIGSELDAAIMNPRWTT